MAKKENKERIYHSRMVGMYDDENNEDFQFTDFI